MALHKRVDRVALALGVAALALVIAAPAVSAKARTKLVSVTSAELQGDDDSFRSDISGDGKFIVFASDANLVLPDLNFGSTDIFLRNRKAGWTRLISKSTAGVQGDSDASRPAISGSGRFIAFSSSSTNLIAGGTGSTRKVYLRDRKKGTTSIVSVDRFGGEPDAGSHDAAISSNGRFIAYSSTATDIVDKDTNGVRQVYRFDRKTGKTRLISKNNKGDAGDADSDSPSISGDGAIVSYSSVATNLFKNDDNDKRDIFARYPNGKTKLISKNKGRRGNSSSHAPSISANGRYIVYATSATNLVKPDANGNLEDVMRFDRKTGKTRRVGVYGKAGKQGKPGDAHGSEAPDVSGNGRYVVWEAYSTRIGNDSNDEFDIFRRDIVSKRTKRISSRPDGKAGAGASENARVSANGRWVAFESVAEDLVASDSNGLDDVFVRGRLN